MRPEENSAMEKVREKYRDAVIRQGNERGSRGFRFHVESYYEYVRLSENFRTPGEAWTNALYRIENKEDARG